METERLTAASSVILEERVLVALTLDACVQRRQNVAPVPRAAWQMLMDARRPVRLWVRAPGDRRVVTATLQMVKHAMTETHRQTMDVAMIVCTRDRDACTPCVEMERLNRVNPVSVFQRDPHGRSPRVMRRPACIPVSLPVKLGERLIAVETQRKKRAKIVMMATASPETVVVRPV